MKKFIAVIVACLTCSGIYAQRAYEGANLGDNWSIGIHAGVTTPLTHSAFFPNMRATWGLATNFSFKSGLMMVNSGCNARKVSHRE